MKGLLSQEPCSVLVGNEANIIFDNLLDQYHMTTLKSSKEVYKHMNL